VEVVKRNALIRLGWRRRVHSFVCLRKLGVVGSY